MKAAVRDQYGPPDVVHVEEVPTPAPTDDQVLVRVHAASINRADLDSLYPRWQFTRLFLGLRRPRLRGLGLDVAGSVEAVGQNVTRFRPGDDVFADLSLYGAETGAFADYVRAPEKAFLPLPNGMSHDEAATLPHAAVLAVQALRTRKGRTVGKGARVLVVGASGNVGPFAVQIAKSRGAHVTGVASTDKLEFVRALGADEVIDYETTDYTRTPERYDWIVDVDAHQRVLAWRRKLLPEGVYVALGGPGTWIASSLVQGPAATLATDKTLGLMLHWKPFKQDDVDVVTGLIAAGRVKPIIDRRFALSDAAEALRYVDDGHARGKVLVIP